MFFFDNKESQWPTVGYFSV